MDRFYLIRKNVPYSVFINCYLTLIAALVHLSISVYDTSVLIFRASYDTSAPNAKRKYQDEGETDEDKMEEYKASREQGNFMVRKK